MPIGRSLVEGAWILGGSYTRRLTEKRGISIWGPWQEFSNLLELDMRETGANMCLCPVPQSFGVSCLPLLSPSRSITSRGDIARFYPIFDIHYFLSKVKIGELSFTVSPFRSYFISFWGSSSSLGHPNDPADSWAHFAFDFESQGLSTGAKPCTLLMSWRLRVSPQAFSSVWHLRTDALGSVSEVSPKPRNRGTSATGLGPQVAAVFTLLQQEASLWWCEKRQERLKIRVLHSYGKRALQGELALGSTPLRRRPQPCLPSVSRKIHT